MDKLLNSKKFVLFLIILIICLGLLGCAKPNVDGNKKEHTVVDSIGNMGAIGKALGCMFGSNDPICDKPNTNEDTDEEWQEVDEN